MPEFKPSRVSLSSRGAALQYLAYARKALDRLERQLKALPDDEELPHWVLERMNQAASCLGQAYSFVCHRWGEE